MNKTADKNRFLILYGSQTGNSKAIAEEIADNAALFGLAANLHCLSWTEKKFNINQESCIVFVISTTGEGEPPDTTLKFFRRITKCTLDNDYLEGLHYTILALGDSNYPTFCACGKQLDKRLQELSAKRFYSVGYCDEVLGIETSADSWISGLWPALKKHLGVTARLSQTTSHFVLDQVTNLQKANNLVFESVMEVVSKKNDNHYLDDNLLNSHADENFVSKGAVNASKESSNLSIYSLHCMTEVLESNNLKVPYLPEPFLVLSFLPRTANARIDQLVSVKNCNLVPSSASILETQLIHAKKLTFSPDVKESLELTFRFKADQSEDVNYKPGDSFGFLCPNPHEEVTTLLERLGQLKNADIPCCISVKEEHLNKTKHVSHLPKSSTLREILTSFCEIRSVPKKVLLGILAENSSNDIEKLCLKFLCSREGSSLYTECVRTPALCLLDVLFAFKSCNPPIERILEHFPQLKPRFYSVASSPLTDSSLFRIVFNVVEIEKGRGRYDKRAGVCTGWLLKISKSFFPSSFDLLDSNISKLYSNLSLLSLDCKVQDSIFIFRRRNKYFFMPDNPSVPIIMVGPGSGIAPFIGFLQHRELLMKNARGKSFGDSWLFFGCRYKDKDFLYSEELHRLVKSKVLTNLKVSFSRDIKESSMEIHPRYVQDNIIHHAKDICSAIDLGAIIYVCGDAKHMVRDVSHAFSEVLRISKSISVEEAKAYVKYLESEKRYIIDVWA